MLKRLSALLLVSAASIVALAESDFIPSEPLRAAGLMKYWQLQLPLEPHQTLTDVYYVDDQIYACTNDGYVFAIHADTGVVRWLRPATRSGYRLRRPVHLGERVAFSSPTGILLLDRRMGDALLSIDVPSAQGTGLATDGRMIIVGCVDRRVYAYDSETGIQLWKYTTGGPNFSTPMIYGDDLYMGSDDGSVLAASLRDKRFKWQAVTFGSNSADIVAAEPGVFVPSRDSTLYLFDLGFGEVRWRYTFSGPLNEAPVINGSICYQYCPDDGVVALNVDVLGVTERKLWALPRGRAVVTYDEKHSFVLTNDHQVVVVDSVTGALKNSIPAPGLNIAIQNADPRTLAVASPGGRIFTARAIGAQLPTLADMRAAQLPPPTATAKATTQPATNANAMADPLASQRRSTPMGGKSKVSRDYGKRPSTPPADKEKSKSDDKPNQ